MEKATLRLPPDRDEPRDDREALRRHACRRRATRRDDRRVRAANPEPFRNPPGCERELTAVEGEGTLCVLRGSNESGRPGSNRRRPAWEAFWALAGQGFFDGGSRNGITQYAGDAARFRSHLFAPLDRLPVRRGDQMTSLRGKVAVVSGASSGVGKATVQALVGEGVRVTAVARGGDGLRALRAEAGAGVETVQADASDPAVADRLIRELKPDLVVLAAGIHPAPGPPAPPTLGAVFEAWNTDL